MQGEQSSLGSGLWTLDSCLVSIHDVAPESLANVRQIVGHLKSLGIQTVTLLVIPGCEWGASEIDALRSLRDQGCELAGHGWIHRCGPKRTWYHRLHGWCLSRNVAEHLSLDPERIAELIQNCYAWFDESGLGRPELYVPPAWAMGPITLGELRGLPFQFYEVLSGVYDARNDAFHRLPLLGYEADTTLRSVTLRCLNTLTVLVASRLDRPVRVSIHPNDLQLRMAASLKRGLARVRQTVGYAKGCGTVTDLSARSAGS